MQGLSDSQQVALDAIGITRWQRRAPPPLPRLQVITAGVLKPMEADLLEAMLAAIDLSIGVDVQQLTSPQQAIDQTACAPFWLLLGTEVAETILGQTQPLDALRGRWHPLEAAAGAEGPTILVTEAPEALLRRPAEKARVWEDLRLLRRTLQAAA